MVVQPVPGAKGAGASAAAAGQDASSFTPISNFAGIPLPKPVTAKGQVVVDLDTSGLEEFHGQLLASLSKSEVAINSARQDHFELRAGVIDVSEKVGNHSIHLNSLKTEIFKLKEDNSAQQDQIVELRAQLKADREAFEKAQAEQASAIKALTAEVRASAEKIASLTKAQNSTTIQVEVLAKQDAARGSPALRPVTSQPSSSPYLRSAAPPGGAPYTIQWPASGPPSSVSSAAPSPMIQALAPGTILPPAPMQGGLTWTTAPPQQVIFR